MKKLMTLFAFMALIVAAGNAQSVKAVEKETSTNTTITEDFEKPVKVDEAATDATESASGTDSEKEEKAAGCSHDDKAKGKSCCSSKKAASGCGSKAKAKSGCCASKAEAKSEEDL